MRAKPDIYMRPFMDKMATARWVEADAVPPIVSSDSLYDLFNRIAKNPNYGMYSDDFKILEFHGWEGEKVFGWYAKGHHGDPQYEEEAYVHFPEGETKVRVVVDGLPLVLNLHWSGGWEEDDPRWEDYEGESLEDIKVTRIEPLDPKDLYVSWESADLAKSMISEGNPVSDVAAPLTDSEWNKEVSSELGGMGDPRKFLLPSVSASGHKKLAKLRKVDAGQDNFPHITDAELLGESLGEVANTYRREDLKGAFKILGVEREEHEYEMEYIPPKKRSVRWDSVDPPEYWAQNVVLYYNKGKTKIEIVVEDVPISMTLHWTQEPLKEPDLDLDPDPTFPVRITDVTDFSPKNLHFGDPEEVAAGEYEWGTLSEDWKEVVEYVKDSVEDASDPDTLLDHIE